MAMTSPGVDNAGAGATVELQWPFRPGRLHCWFGPLQAVSQHTSSTQKPLWHCAAAEHGEPNGNGVFVGVAVGVLVGVVVGVAVRVPQKSPLGQLALLPRQDAHVSTLHDVVGGLNTGPGQIWSLPKQLPWSWHGPLGGGPHDVVAGLKLLGGQT